MNQRTTRDRRTRKRATGTILAVTLTLTACVGEPGDREPRPDSAAFTNVRDHLPGAETLNVTCPDGAWEPQDRDGNPVTVGDANGDPTSRLAIDIGETITVTDPLTGKNLDLLCVPEFLPEFGDEWIGEWAGMGLISNVRWRPVLHAFLAGGAVSTRIHEIVVDPYGVIRSYRLVVGIPSAMEQDPVTGGIISQMYPDQNVPTETGEPWPMPGAAAPGTPPEGSHILVRTTPETTLRLEAPRRSLRLDGHDFAVTAEGNFLAIGYELIEEPGESFVIPALAPNRCRDRKPGEPVTTLRARVVEYARDGSVVKIWRSEDHLPAGVGPAIRFGVPEIDGKRVCVYDIEHPNAIDVTDDGDVIVGFRNALTPAVLIDWESGRIRWTLGGEGPQALTVKNDPYDGPVASHDATLTRENGSNILAILDNNSGRGTPRYVRYALDETAGTATLITEIPLSCREGTCYSLLGGSAHVFRGEGETAEMLLNLGGIVTEDVTVPINGQLLYYRGEELVNTIPLGPWWLYRATVYSEEPWARSSPAGN